MSVLCEKICAQSILEFYCTIDSIVPTILIIVRHSAIRVNYVITLVTKLSKFWFLSEIVVHMNANAKLKTPSKFEHSQARYDLLKIKSNKKLLHIPVQIALNNTSRKHLRAKVTPSLYLKYSKNGGNLGYVSISITLACFSIFLSTVEK